MAARLARELEHEGCPAAVLSLDDFYLRRSERVRLAREVHPLLATRGVPGTHDVGLLLGCLTRLIGMRSGKPIVVPVFDKTCDDRAPEADWRQVDGPVEVVIVEGWCIGAGAQPQSDLVLAVNNLEREEDPDERWRRYVNDRLSGEYRELFARLDLRVFLRAPSFEIIHHWRAEQEAGLQRMRAGSRPPMDEVALHRFISHYERLTRWMHEDEPADLVVDLDANRVPLGCRAGSSRARSHGSISRRAGPAF